MTSRNTTSGEQRFRRAKFIFDDLEKFIVMDVFLKVALDDLKFSFSKILNLDFFGKRFIYQFQDQQSGTQNGNQDLDASKLLEEQECIKNFIENQQNLNREMQFKVKFEDIGA
ncbi:hypothetical protein ABPG74_002951 [Tetrahymena malaccensis]